MPRSEPAATVWMASAMKKVDPTSSSVAESSAVRIVAFPQENFCDAKAADDHGEGQHGGERDAEPGGNVAGAPDRAGVAAADGVADPHGGGHADAERHHEQDGGDLSAIWCAASAVVLITPIKSPAAPNRPYSSRKESEIGVPMTMSCHISFQSMRQK